MLGVKYKDKILGEEKGVKISLNGVETLDSEDTKQPHNVVYCSLIRVTCINPSFSEVLNGIQGIQPHTLQTTIVHS